MEIDLEVDIKKALAELDLLPKEANTATTMAINKLADAAKSEAARQISQRARLPLQKVRKRISVQRASRYSLMAVVRGLPYSPNLSHYNPTQDSAGTGANVVGSPVRIPSAFILKDKAGRPVMIRARRGGKSGPRVGRLPLESVRVEVLQRSWVNTLLGNTLAAVIHERWPLEFSRAVNAVRGRR